MPQWRPPERSDGGQQLMGGLATFVLEPAFVLSVVVGAFHTCVYIFVRGRLGWHIPALLMGAIIGAMAGQAIGARVGGVFVIGDYNLVWASAFAWLGIGIALVTSGLVSRKPDVPPDGGGQVRARRG
jgi:hypothetical protein